MRDQPLRGVAAFVATFVVAILFVEVAVFAIGATSGWRSQWSWESTTFIAIYVGMLLTPLAPLAIVTALMLKVVSLPRPLADIVVSSLAFVVLWLSLWMPVLAGYADETLLPVTLAAVAFAAASGAVWGLVYWLFAGKPHAR